MQDLGDRIASVFSETPVPAAEELLHPECSDATAVLPFEGWTSWWDIPQEVLCRNYDALSFFSPAAFRFFLPAFLVATLRLFRTSNDFVSDATVFELNPHSDYARSRYVLFTRDECGVVTEFLEHMVENPSHADAATARSALDGFWRAAAGRSAG